MINMQLTDLSASVLRQGILSALRVAREGVPQSSQVAKLERTTSDFYAGLAKLDADLLATSHDRNLSSEGQRAKRAELGVAWKATSALQLSELEATVNALGGNQEPLSIKPPVTEPAILEAKLANARSDARMLLDRVEVTQLPGSMRELVEREADPVVTYLLVATEWGSNYLRSRLPTQGRGLRANLGHASGEHGALLEWARIRSELFPSLLDEADRREYQRRERLAGVARVPQVVRETRHFIIKSRGLA